MTLSRWKFVFYSLWFFVFICLLSVGGGWWVVVVDGWWAMWGWGVVVCGNGFRTREFGWNGPETWFQIPGVTVNFPLLVREMWNLSFSNLRIRDLNLPFWCSETCYDIIWIYHYTTLFVELTYFRKHLSRSKLQSGINILFYFITSAEPAQLPLSHLSDISLPSTNDGKIIFC